MSLLNKNTNFNKAPYVSGAPRTRFDLSHQILTTFNTGDFVPILCEPVYPGSTHSLRTNSLTRLETSLHQTMDNAYIEFAFFFVPWEQVMDDFDKFMGANDDPWTQTTVYTIPQILLAEKPAISTGVGITPGSLLNHLMLPVGNYGVSGTPDRTNSLHVEQLSLRSVFKVWNDWYRNENVDSIIYYSTGNTDVAINEQYVLNGANFRANEHILKVNRLHDLFSTALPAPQKAQDITINMMPNLIPVVAGATSHDVTTSNVTFSKVADNTPYLSSGTLGVNSGKLAVGSGTVSSPTQIAPNNFYGQTDGAVVTTINQLRLAIVRQAIAERDARGGTRLNEQVSNIWDTHVNSLEIGRSEFLGGKRLPVNMMEVLQTSETGTTVLGTDAGHSKTFDSDDSFVRSFTQWGFILGFCYIRTARSYSQGIDRKHFMVDRLDLVDPMLDNIGEIPVLKKELFSMYATSADLANANSVFGYQEQHYWVKSRGNRFSGYYQPGITGTIDSWHYGDDYNNFPTLSAAWMKEDASRVDRTIAVQSNASFQWSININFEYYVTMPLKKYSIPNTFGF